MEFITKAQEKALNERASLQASAQAKEKGHFPKRHFTRKDIGKMIHNRKKVAPTLLSVLKTAGVIRKHDQSACKSDQINEAQFEAINRFILETLDMDEWGVAKFEAKDIFKGMGIPYSRVIVMSRHMDKKPFVVSELPNMECMIEVMKVYGDTGIAALRLTEFLREMQFGALPNHSLGGNIDYTKAGYKAGLGFVGKHGMLITKKSGACHRLSVVYTNITNLEEFLPPKEDHSWGYDFCKLCKKCVRNCPHQAIYDEAKVDENGHVECISDVKCGAGFAHYGCAICIAACPFTKVGYEKIQEKTRKFST